MESGWTQDLLNWLSANPGWAGSLIFLISFVESLIVIGIVVPGIFFLFGVGTLIGLGAMELLPVWIGGSTGAFLGDLLSYSIGHRYRRHLAEIWPFSQYPGMLDRGMAFFRKHGAKSVFAGRFIGPLRPVIPAIAGMLGMMPGRFTGVCVLSSLLWTPAYLLPGIFFGASLEVASEYAGRLTLVLIIMVVVLWLTWWSIRAIYEIFASRSARWLGRAIRWSRRHPVLGRIAGPILDPSQPEVLSVSMLGLLLVVTLWGLVFLLFLSPFASQPQAIDQAVLATANSLRNHIADPFMVLVSQLSRLWVLVPTSMATLLWLVGAQRINAAIHWLVAMVGGILLQVLVSWTLRATPAFQAAGGEHLYVPSAATTLTTVVLGFFSVMVAKELRRRHRKWPYLATALLMSLLLVARIYLGLDWLSGALVGFILGLAWTAIVGIAYRQRALKPFSGAIASSIFFGTLAITMAWQVDERLDDDLAALQLPLPTRSMQAQTWWQGGWAEMPVERTGSKLVAARRLNLQIGAKLEEITARLEENGWEVAELATWRWVMQALNPDPDEASLPLIGKGYLGYAEVQILRKPGEEDLRQLTIRIWDSGTVLQPADRKLYLGQLSEEVLVQRMRLFSYWRALPVTDEQLDAVAGELATFDIRRGSPQLLIVR